MCTIEDFFSILCNKAATEATALSYQSLFLMSHDWTVPLPCRFPELDVAALERALSVPSHNRIVLRWNCPVSDIYPRFPSDYRNIQKVMHLTPLASQLPRGSLAAALIACDGSITLGLWLDGSIIILTVGFGFLEVCLFESKSWRLTRPLL